jgi:hypothetical protein
MLGATPPFVLNPGLVHNYGMDKGYVQTRVKGWRVRNLNTGSDKRFSFLHNVQPGSEAHPFSHSISTRVNFGDKAAGVSS